MRIIAANMLKGSKAPLALDPFHAGATHIAPQGYQPHVAVR